jgi:hypothetical protein
MKRALQTAFFLTILIVSGLVAGGCALPTNGTDDDPEGVDTMAQPTQMQATKTGWAANGSLHTQVYNEVVNCQAQFGDSGNYTLQFDIDAPQVSGGAQAEAIVTWSVAGNDVTRRLSISNSASITGTAEAVKIRVVDVTFTNPGNAPGTEYKIAIQVAKGTRGDSQIPPVLFPRAFVNGLGGPVTPFEQIAFSVTADGFAGTGAGVGFQDIPIPQDAGVTTALVLATVQMPVPQTYQAQATALVIPDDSVLVEVINTSTSASTIYDPRRYKGWIPIPAGANVLRLLNTMTAGQPAVSFSVFLGIDG